MQHCIMMQEQLAFGVVCGGYEESWLGKDVRESLVLPGANLSTSVDAAKCSHPCRYRWWHLTGVANVEFVPIHLRPRATLVRRIYIRISDIHQIVDDLTNLHGVYRLFLSGL